MKAIDINAYEVLFLHAEDATQARAEVERARELGWTQLVAMMPDDGVWLVFVQPRRDPSEDG